MYLVLLSLDARTLMEVAFELGWTYVDFGPVGVLRLNGRMSLLPQVAYLTTVISIRNRLRETVELANCGTRPQLKTAVHHIRQRLRRLGRSLTLVYFWFFRQS